MKKEIGFLLIVIAFLMAGCKKDPVVDTKKGTFQDSRDNHQYKWIIIGSQTWMAENLAYLPAVSPSQEGSFDSSLQYVMGYEGVIVQEAQATATYSGYGALYNWTAALTACPPGWHLPTDEEWTVLTDYLTASGYGFQGSGNDIGKSIAANSGWMNIASEGKVGNDQSVNNLSGLTIVPGGSRNDGSGFVYQGRDAYFWSSSADEATTAWGRYLRYVDDRLNRAGSNRSDGFSIRCLKD